MASLSGVSSSNSLSSLMNSANMITGLASGLDTESMIENLVKSYQAKINQLNQKVTKVEWKQDAYRSIISKMVAFADKYTSYTSSTNLMSRSFFSNAVTVSALGKYADMVSASGKSSSDISLNSVQQLAKAAQYRTKSNLASENTGTISGKEIGLFDGDNIELSNLSGNLTLTYGSKTVRLSFDETEDMEAINNIREKLGDEATDAEVLAELINQKLADKQITFTNGNTENADQRIKATADASGKITFSELGKAGNGVYISGASGNIASQLGLSSSDLKNADKKRITTIDTNKMTGSNGEKGLTRTMSGLDYLTERSGSAMSFTLDGVTKTISTPKIEVKQEKELIEGTEEDEDGPQYKTVTNYYVDGKKAVTVDEGEEISAEQQEAFTAAYKDALQESLDKAFGTTKNEAGETESKIKVENLGEGGSLKLKFTVDKGSELAINSSAGDALGIGKNATSYLTTSKTLDEVMGDKLDALTPAKDKDGNELKDANGNTLYEFKINDVVIGTYSKNSTLEDILSDINANEAAGVKAVYSQTTQSFTFTAKETGAESKVEMGDGLASAMFSISVSGQDKVSEVFKGLELGENDSQTIAFETPSGIIGSFEIDSNTTMDRILEELGNTYGAEGYAISYDSVTGKIIADDGNGNQINVELSKAHYVENGGKWPDLVVDEKLEYANASKVSYTAGQDARFTVTINGEEMEMTRSSNTVNIDGLSITMKDTFTAESANDAVTFKTSTDSDKIIDVIKEMVNDYNAMMSEIKSAYGTMPYQSSNGAFSNYEPLTEDDMEGMSEAAIARYEEKAKQGLLFGDQTLSTLYDKMTQAFSFSTKADVDALKDMGISVSFNKSNGTSAVTIDEDKLRAMLDSDPDKVANLFTKKDGIMDRMKTQLDNYAKTVGEPKGILIQQAGSPLSSLSLMNNQWQSEIDNYNTQIEKWQTKLQSQVERYTSQFARMEQLIAQMNNQSSTLAGLMGG